MTIISRILNNQFELNDSMRSYDEVSYVRPDLKKDEKGVYKERVEYLEYKGVSEYPDDGIIGYKVEKIYEKCEHANSKLMGTFHKCEDCGQMFVKK